MKQNEWMRRKNRGERMKVSAFLLFLLFSLSSFAQKQQISGKVTDGITGEALPGVNILLKGTTVGVITDFDGNYLIPVSGKGTLTFSFIGYRTKEVKLEGKTKLDVTLEVDATGLDEVVVVGYGTMRKSDLTGSLSTVSVEETVARQSQTVDQLLQGRASGVQVTSNGSPGAGVSIRIRGASSLRGNNEPLYVVDGVIISSAGEDATVATDNNSLQESQNGLNGINPRDIKSIEVLKDASATAIYGSRGANGVILITTKKGAKGKTKVNAYASFAVSEITKRIDVLDAVDYAKYQNEIKLMNDQGPDYHIENGNIYRISNPNEAPRIGDVAAKQYNWHDEIYKLGQSYNAGVSFSGGSEKGNYYISAGYNDQGGIVDNSRFQSGDFRLNLNRNINDKLKISTRFTGFYAEGNFAQDGDRVGGNRSFISNIVTYKPLTIPGDELIDTDEGLSGPYTWVNDFQDVSKENRFVGSVALTYELPVEGLQYKLQAGGNIRNKERRRFYGTSTWQGSIGNGVLSMSDLESKSYQINNLLMYNKTIKKDHRINSVLGVTWDQRMVENMIYQVNDFSTTTFGTDQPAYAQVIDRPMEMRISDTKLLSFLGRVNYSYKGKYMATASFRTDGSSKFSKENRFSFFPSVSVAWLATEEGFLKSFEAMNNLKLRAGWGQIGNQAISPYQTLANYGNLLYATPANSTSVAYTALNISNKDLKWETTEQINVGVDFGFFNNRLSGTIDVYHKATKDLLQNASLPSSTGFERMLINRGSITNQGIDFAVNGVVYDSKDFNITLGGNISFNRSKVVELGMPLDNVYIDGKEESRSFYLGDEISSGGYFRSPANIFMEGQPIGVFFGYETDGIYQTDDEILVEGAVPGDIRIIDQNGDGVINGVDRTIIGDPNPDFIFGANLSIRYKRFSLSALMNGVYGSEVANGNLLSLATAEGQGTNIMPAAYHNAWRPDAPSTTYPRLGYNKENQAIAITDRIIEDASYFRISNITLSYDLPLEKVFSRFNVYVSAINPLTITGYSGYNPEVTNFMSNGNILGVDWNGYPNSRTFLAGVNINF